MSFSGIFARVVALIGAVALLGAVCRARRTGLGRRAGDPGGKAARRHPDAQDADGAGDGATDKSRLLRPGSRSTRLRPVWTIRAGSTCCPMATCLSPRRRRSRAAQERVPLCDAGDDAACRGARRQRQPHHRCCAIVTATASPRREDFHGGTEPAVRHGAGRRHLLCRQYRRRGAFPVRGGCGPHHRTGQEARQRSSPPDTGRGACCRARTARSSMPASARSATSPRRHGGGGRCRRDL